MKKFNFLMTLILCFSLTSCSYFYDRKYSILPEYSDNFDKDFIASFSQNYDIVDFQLGYLVASSCEVELVGKTSMEKLRLAIINETDKNEFVSVTRVKYPLYGAGYSSETYVYKSKDAPMPMRDWTIKSISIVASPTRPTYGNERSFEDVSQNLMQIYLDSSDILYVYNLDTDMAFINSIKDAYLNSDNASKRTQLVREILPEDSSKQEIIIIYYSLFITFEENSNIVWYADLYKSGSEILFICGTAEYASDINQRYGKISDEFAEQIKELLVADGCDKFD